MINELEKSGPARRSPAKRGWMIVLAASLLPCILLIALFLLANRQDRARAWFEWPKTATHLLRNADWQGVESLVTDEATIHFADGRPITRLADLISEARKQALAPGIYGSFPHHWHRFSDDHVTLDFWVVIEEMSGPASYQVKANLHLVGGTWKVADLSIH